MRRGIERARLAVYLSVVALSALTLWAAIAQMTR
jgi:hypothetical protein